MGDSPAQREAPPAARGPPRREPYGGAQHPQKNDDDVCFVKAYRGAQEGLAGDSARIADRRLSSPPQVVHQRHMPVGTQNFHIPRKTKEKLALFQPLSCESREYEDVLTILTSAYLEPASSSCFSYSKPRLVHSETLEKEFVEKRKELKADGRTEKELEESYCFMLGDSYRLQVLCEKGLFIGQSWVTVLGDPQKGVYLSRCSDLLQMNPLTPGASGEILIFKVIKGKVKSIYENMKNLLDPTPRFDSHLSKNISKVTSVTSYRAFELTQQYFYEYSFDELRQRPRQVCPYAVVSFQFKVKDTPLTSKPMVPLRFNNQSSEKSQERAQFTVWSGDLVKDDRVLFQVSLRSASPPSLPHKLPEKLEIKCVMRWNQAIRGLPQSLFSYNLYNNSSQEVEKDGFHCSLLEVVDRSRSMTSVTKLLQELESKAVVLVTPLTERGFLFLLSSVQMALTHERGENWRRSLHALFVFPESRCTKSAAHLVCFEPSPDLVSADSVMFGLNHFVPALHFALGKARTNPPVDLSAGVEQQAKEYINGIKEGVMRPYPMGKYEPELEQAGRQYPVPKLHRLGLDSCLRPYLCGAARHLLLLSRVRTMVQPLCVRLKHRQEPERTLSQADHKMQQLIDLVLSCKRNAEKEVQSELKSGMKRNRLEQETAQRAIKHLKASQELQHLNTPQQQNATEVASPGSLTSLIGSVGLKDADLQDKESELATQLLSLLTSLNQKATNQNTPEPQGAGPKESSPFDRLALKLGLLTNCDIDLRKQEDFEGGSVSSQEGGFSPTGDPRPAHKDQDRDPRKRPKTTGPVLCEEEPPQPHIPWVLIPITGLPPVHYSRKDPDLPLDPRLHHLLPTVATTPPPTSSVTVETLPTATASSSVSMETDTAVITSSPAAPLVPSSSTTPDPSPPASPSQCPSPDPSTPSHCPSPDTEPEPGVELSEAFNDPHTDRGEAFNDPHADRGEVFNDLHVDRGEAFNDPHADRGEAFNDPHADRGEAFNDLHADRGEALNDPHADRGEAFNDPHADRAEAFNDPHANRGEAFNDPHADRAEAFNDPHANRGEVFNEPHADRGEAFNDPHVDRGEAFNDLHADRGEAFNDPHADRGEAFNDPNADKGEAFNDLHADRGEAFNDLHADRGEAFNDLHADRGEAFNDLHADREEAFNDLHADRGVAFEVPQEDEEMQRSGDTAEPSPEGPLDASSAVAQPSPKTPSPQKPTDQEEEPLQDVLSIDPMSPPLPLQNIDSIVDRHLDSFSSDIQRILQTQSVSYSFPQSPHSTSNTERMACTLSHAPMSQFSQYVSFYHPCPPVHRYVSSLQRQISGVLIDYANSWTPNRPDTTSATTVPATTDLASRVSEFVASIRAANDDRDPLPEAELWQSDAEGQVTTSSVDYLDNTALNDVICSDPENETDEDVSGNGRRQVQFSSNHLEICIRNEPERSSSNSMEMEDVTDPSEVSPPISSDQNTLNCLIDQLQPEVFTNLVEIIKDLKRNAQHFYIHCSEEDDYTIQQIRAQLLKQSYIEKSPVLFLNQEEKSNGKLLVVIKNQDIAAHIHQIPELLSLKRCPSVQFLGVDSAEDLRNQSCQELFTSGGQVLSDEMVLNPDCVSHDKLSALLSVLENNTSAKNLWRWKVHCKTHKRLKEQSRFRRDAASLLEVLLSFQKKEIVDFLPYHKCDTSQGCELLDCAIELQGRYSNYRHTVVLTENRLGNSSGGGVIVCGIDEFIHDFRKVFGNHDNIRQLNKELQSSDDPSQSSLVPSDDLGSIPLHSEQDFEVLHRAISQLRAERQQQLRDSLNDTNSNRQGAVSTADVSTTSLTLADQRPFTPLSDKVSVIDAALLTPGRQAVAATLDLIHSSLQPTNEDQTTHPIDHRRSPELQVPIDSVGNRQSLNTEVQTSDWTMTQTRVQVDTQASPDHKRSPDNKAPFENRVPTDPTGHRTSLKSQAQDIDQNPIQSQVPAEAQDQILEQTSTQLEVPAETQPPVDSKQSPETQVQVSTELGGSQKSSVTSAPQKEVAVPGKSEPAATSVRPRALNTHLTQSSTNQEKTATPSTPPEYSRLFFPALRSCQPTSRSTRPDVPLYAPPHPFHQSHRSHLGFPYMGHFIPPQRPMYWDSVLFRGRIRPPPPRGHRGSYGGM